ncbi:hypothetical protein QCA50_008843 [Cerrena zonata]|uniref:Autophagy-related protein 17 n=1 Tax=Cerrena zonata TaxID=2478898 RepID=A0AAW0G7L8_9APHY
MSALGSIFLGDVQRQRILASSTPPSSPPPSVSPSAISHFPDILNLSPKHRDQPAPSQISPALSLDLRVRWLETLLFGAKQDCKTRGVEISNPSLLRGIEDLQHKIDTIVQGNDGLRRFMEHYEQHAHLLTPSFALSGTVPVSSPYENMSSSELEAFLTEMEQDIKAADSDLREIEALEKKNVTAAGKLTDYESLKPRLEKLIEAHTEDLQLAADLEKRVANLMDHYATHMDTLSELFVAWDDTIEEADSQATKLQRDQDERQRLGYE